MVQADPNYRLDEASLNRHFVRLSNGEMAPLSQFVTLTKVYGAESLNRFNMYNSIALNAMPAEGYSSGEAIRAVQETAARVLPPTMISILADWRERRAIRVIPPS